MIELSLARDLKGNRKSICMHMGNKWETTENVGPLWKETGDLVTEDNEKAEVFNDIFVPVFNGKCSTTPPAL